VLDGDYGSTAPRTVVYLAPITSPGHAETFSPGSLRELRAVVVAQHQTNLEARRDEHRVPVVVRLANPGDRFAHGREVAADIGRAAERDPSIVGVIGISQSRTVSREVIGTIEEAGLPVVAGTVTGDLMARSSDLYYQVAPINDRIAEMMAEFATQVPIVDEDRHRPDTPGTPQPAAGAVIVTDHTDEYAWNLAEDVERHLASRNVEIIRTFSYAAEDPGEQPEPDQRADPRPSLGELGEAVCARIEDPDRDVVIFTARSQQLAGMLDGMRGDPDYPRPVTMVTGSDTRDFLEDPETGPADYSFVRLWYPAFAAAPPHEGNEVARDFVAAYTERYGDDDLSHDISGPALNYDAFLLMRAAINQVAQGGDNIDVTRGSVAGQLGTPDGVRLNGASGYIAFGAGERVPRDKLVLVLKASADDATLHMRCGRVTSNEEHTLWGSSGEFTCPQDG
jgi:hypothetical protein